jgi:hypothetical protein
MIKNTKKTAARDEKKMRTFTCGCGENIHFPIGSARVICGQCGRAWVTTNTTPPSED